jgi:hypothetical protein
MGISRQEVAGCVVLVEEAGRGSEMKQVGTGSYLLLVAWQPPSSIIHPQPPPDRGRCRPTVAADPHVAPPLVVSLERGRGTRWRWKRRRHPSCVLLRSPLALHDATLHRNAFLQAACSTPMVEDGFKRGPVIKLYRYIVILLWFSPTSKASSPSCPCKYTQKISLTVNIRLNQRENGTIFNHLRLLQNKWEHLDMVMRRCISTEKLCSQHPSYLKKATITPSIDRPSLNCSCHYYLVEGKMIYIYMLQCHTMWQISYIAVAKNVEKPYPNTCD